MLEKCPKELPESIISAVRALAEAYLGSQLRQQLSQEVVDHWNVLIDAWSNDASLPLFIRKQSADIGELLEHVTTKRKLAPCDNSPSHWAIISAFESGTNIWLAEVRSAIKAHNIPVTMTMSSKDVENSTMKGTLAKNKMYNAGNRGWKVDHIDPVGLRKRGPIQDMDIEVLKRHFRLLMKPSNIVLVPSKLKGLGDMPTFIDCVKAERPPNPI